MKARMPPCDPISLFKIKQDLKETSLSPYQIPFNFEILNEKLTIEPSNKFAYRQYVLPDHKTLMTIDVGKTEKEVVKELINLYSDSSLYYLETNKYFGNMDQTENGLAASRKIKR